MLVEEQNHEDCYDVETTDQGGVLPSQWFDSPKSAEQLEPEALMWLAALLLTCQDLKDLFAHRRVRHDPRGAKHNLKKAREAYDYIHSDSLGGDDPFFVSCRMVCKAADVDLIELRKYMATFGTREDLDKISFKRRRPNNYTEKQMARRQLGRATKEAA